MINKLSVLSGAKYFSLGLFWNYLVFIPVKKHRYIPVKYFTGTTSIELWKSNIMPEESIENITKSDSNFAPTFVDHQLLSDMNSNGHCSIKNNISIPKKVTNLYVTVWKVSKYGFFSGPNTGKYGSEKTPVWSLFVQCVSYKLGPQLRNLSINFI